MNSRAPLKKDEKGFTIIEVMIVLAIAGLIILIVFLAVPALQRNSRNTQRRNDVARLSGLVAEHVTNNNGRVPSGIGTGSGEIDVSIDDFSYYDVADLSVDSTATPAPDVDTIQIKTSVTCSNNVLTDAGNRAYAVSFRVETSNDSTVGEEQCV